MGRRKKAPEDKREKNPIRLSKTELDLIKRAAGAKGQGWTTWARETLLRAAKRAIKARGK